MRRLIVLLSFVAVASVAVASASSGMQPLPVNNLYGKNGKATTLQAGVTYQANQSFPKVAPRFTPPDGSWSGAQWKTTAWGKKRPYFGWVGIGQGPTSGAPPLGSITIMTMQARTRSATATANWLRTRGHGVSYGPTSTVTVAGFTGTQFDGTIVAKEHTFLPFSHPTGASVPYGDALYLQKGDALRFIVLNVRGHAVVVYLERAGLSADQFPAFLTRANALLKTLKFSR